MTMEQESLNSSSRDLDFGLAMIRKVRESSPHLPRGLVTMELYSTYMGSNTDSQKRLRRMMEL